MQHRASQYVVAKEDYEIVAGESLESGGLGNTRCGKAAHCRVRNLCRTFAEVSYALLCTVMQFATGVTAKKQRKFNN
jgi:hypothetical protein